MTAFLTNGCLTPALLDKVDPNEKIIISSSDTTEEQLQRKNLLYAKRDGYFVVEKTPWQKTGDYTVLATGLPFTATADVALAACCVFLIWEAHTDHHHHHHHH